MQLSTRQKRVFIFLLLPLLTIAVLRRVERKTFSLLSSDVEGYYMYLPAVFLTGFDNVPVRTHSEFVKRPSGLYFTRFNYGVALTEAPFFFVALPIAAAIYDEPLTGYELPFEFAIIVSQVLCTVIGLFLLGLYLDRNLGRKTILFLITLLCGTSLLYFGVYDGIGHSHAVSFMLVSLLLYLSPRIYSPGSDSPRLLWVWALITGVLLLIRPTNILIALTPLLVVPDALPLLRKRIFTLLHPYRLGLGLLIIALLFFPQLLYYKLSQGAWFLNPHDPDGSFEGFPYLLNPHIREVWLDVRNGLFIYAPFLLLLFPALIHQWFQQKNQRLQTVFILLVFLFQSYTLGAWYMYWLGGYGHRGFIELIPLLALVIYPFISSLWVKQRIWRISLICSMLFFSYVGVGMTYKYCWPWQPPGFTWTDYRQVWKEILLFNKRGYCKPFEMEQ